MSNRGKRYDSEPKLNYKKVFAALIAIGVIIMIIVTVAKIATSNKEIKVPSIVSYFTSYSDGKWGIINNLGETVIEPIYDEMLIVPNKDKPVFLCIYEVNDEKGTYKTKAVNNKNEEILKGYDKIEAIDNFDTKQNIWYEDSVLKVNKDGKYGLINLDGTEVLACEYDSIEALKGVTSNMLVKKDEKMGLVNDKGQNIIPVEYKNIFTLKEGYKNEYIIVNQEGRCGIIATSGKVIIEPKYDEINYLSSTELYSVKDGGALKLINTNNEVLIEGNYDQFIQAKGDNIIVVKNGKYGIVNKAGEEKVAPSYELLKYAFGENYIAKKDNRYGVINLANEIKLDFKYQAITYIESGNFLEADISDTESVILDNNLLEKLSGIVSEINTDRGYIKLYKDNDYLYYNFKFEEKKVADILTTNTIYLSKKDGKYGYVNSSGEEVVACIYDDATEQNLYGFAAVKKDGKWGVVDKIGKVILEPSVNLDNSIFSSFIGAWHLDDSGAFYIR